MQIETNHHGGDKTIVLGERELRIPKHIVGALTNVKNVGAVERLYLRDQSDFFIGGRHDGVFAMESQWTAQWNEHGIYGTFKPHIDGDEFFTMLCFWNDLFGRDIPFPAGVSIRIARVNIRSLLPFLRFKQQMGSGRLWEIPIDDVLGDGKPNERRVPKATPMSVL